VAEDLFLRDPRVDGILLGQVIDAIAVVRPVRPDAAR
jgi:hypothetical protein